MGKGIAVLVIDMQNEFIAPGSLLEVKGIRSGLPKFQRFLNRMREKGIPIIYTRHCFTPKTNPIESLLFPRQKGKLHKGSRSWELTEALKPKPRDPIVDKYRYDAFFGSRLGVVLKSKKIKTVIITGTMTNICCESTARSAMFQDYGVVFCADLTFCSDAVVQKNTLKVIASHFGVVRSAAQILRQC